MKKICFILVIFALVLSCFAGCTFPQKAVLDEEKIALVENAQYLPSKELLVDGGKNQAEALAAVSDTFSPYSLLDGGISEEDYDQLVELISPIDTPFNRSFTIQDARDEAIKILSEGVIFDEWFTYSDGDLRGQGSFYVTNSDGRLTITRRSSFQPWVYLSDEDRFVNNDLLDLGKPNYPIRSDNYLRLSFYEENGKEVVECEVVDNLSYYDEVSHVYYQLMRNVKDTSFTKIHTVFRDSLPNPSEEKGDWGYDIDTKDDYSYIRSFTQIDYSSPGDIKWLNATQKLPYAFDASGSSSIELGIRENDEGFYYSLSTAMNANDSFSLTPDDAYLSEDFTVYDTFSANAFFRAADDYGLFSKRYYGGNVDVSLNGGAEIGYYENKINTIAETLDSLSINVSGAGLSDSATASLVFDGSKNDSSFETALNACLDNIAKSATSTSPLALDFKNNDVYNMSYVSVDPLSQTQTEQTQTP